MSEDNITSIGAASNNAKMVSPEQCLRDALSKIGRPEGGALEKGKKVLVVALDDTGDNYDVSFFNAGFSTSEIITLSEVLKNRSLHMMGYLTSPEDFTYD